MKIACLGWGSLIWQPESLLIRRKWFNDGPLLPIEFVRQSENGRLTLVISENAKPVRTLWALMATEDLTEAKNSLGVREGIPKSKFASWIASIEKTEKAPGEIQKIIQSWAESLDLDDVIWTNIPAKFNGIDNTEPTPEEAIQYINSLDINRQALAEEYVRKAPKQIDTQFRRKFESEFGWTFIEE